MGIEANTLGILIVDVAMGPKEVKYAFFVTDDKPLYFVILGRDWMHTNKCVPSTLHLRLMFWLEYVVWLVGSSYTINILFIPYK
jgi:uncharacterized protein (DUF983 family)